MIRIEKRAELSITWMPHRSLGDHETVSETLNIHNRSLRRNREGEGAQRPFRNSVAEFIQYLVKDTSLHIQEPQGTLNRICAKHRTKHITRLPKSNIKTKL